MIHNRESHLEIQKQNFLDYFSNLMIHIVMNLWTFNQGIPIVTLYSYFSILVGKISNVFLQILEYLLTDQGFGSP